MRKEIIETNYKNNYNQTNESSIDYFFSVVICTYNRDKLLPRALQSLINQKYKDFEVIVVDDGSADRTFSVVKEFRNHLNLRYIYQLNKGLSEARNVGGFSAKGEYITFLDSDDEYKQDHLFSRFQILNENRNIELLFGGVEVIGNNFVPDAENPEKLVNLSECVVGGTFFIKKELFQRLNGFRKLNYADDYDFYKRVINEKAKILKTDISTYVYYRDTADSMCNTLINKRKKTSGKEK